MRYPIVFAPGVFEDEQAAFEYYEAIRPGLGRQFLNEVEAVYEKLSVNPASFGYADARHLLRRARTLRFPYVILYEARRGDVLVTRVFHDKRDIQY